MAMNQIPVLFVIQLRNNMLCCCLQNDFNSNPQMLNFFVGWLKLFHTNWAFFGLILSLKKLVKSFKSIGIVLENCF